VSVDFAVPGDPAAVRARAATARAKGQSFTEVADGLARIGTDGWRGRAADHFREAYAREPRRWRDAGEGFLTAAGALEAWASALETAQAAARVAADEHARGERVTAEARAAYDADVAQAQSRAAEAASQGRYRNVVVEPFHDSGQAIRDQALADLAQARAELDAAAHRCADRVRAGCADAPEERNWLESGLAAVGGFLQGAGEAVWELGTLVTMPQWKPAADMFDLATGHLTPEELAMRHQLTVEQAGAMVTALREDPLEFGKNVGKAVVDWDTWADDPARALGHLVPDAVATILSGGAGAAARGVRGLDALADTADAVRDVDRAADGLDTAGDVDRLDDVGDAGRLDGPEPLPDLGDIPFEKGTDAWAEAVSERYPRLTKDEVLGIHDYTTTEGYRTMNNFLRDGEVQTGTTREALESRVQRTVDGLSKLPRHEGVTMRGTDLPEDVLKQWEPGATIGDRAFMSTSVDPEVAERFAQGKNAFLRIEGRSGVDIDPLSEYGASSYGPSEAEILFKPGTEFEVLRKEWNPDLRRWEFDLREVHDGR
jgi:hypothetical protein